MKVRLLTIVSAGVLLAANIFGQSTTPLTNADIVHWVNGGHEQSVIINTIEASSTNFDVSDQGITELEKAGVDQRIIKAMKERQRKKQSPSTEPAPLKPASSTPRKEPAGLPEPQSPKTESGIPLPETPTGSIPLHITSGDVTKPLSNSDVIQMVKAGLKESLILKALEANGAEFDITAPTLIELSKLGVSQNLIEAMISHVETAIARTKATVGKDSSKTASSSDSGVSAPPEVSRLKGLIENADVIHMVKDGVKDSLIAKVIEENNTNFDVSRQSVIELKKSGVSQEIIDLMFAIETKIVPYRDRPKPQ